MSILSQAQLNYSKFFVDDVWDDSYGMTSLGARGSVEKLDFYKKQATRPIKRGISKLSKSLRGKSSKRAATKASIKDLTTDEE